MSSPRDAILQRKDLPHEPPAGARVEHERA
jgi:hypothetical protein